MSNLPVAVTSFVGRRHAAAQVRQSLGTSRLVTLTGVGGVGKTRLALHVADEVRRNFVDGVFVVELARLTEPSLVASTVAAVLDLRGRTDPDTTSTLVRYVADRRMLLVLDNCEHLIEAVSSLAAALLASAPGLRLLATSRESLGIAGETVCTVPPLSVGARSDDSGLPPEAGGLESLNEAQRLFEERASAASPSFRLDSRNEDAVAQICRDLDGLPLAIELAAVRVRAMSAHQIAARIQDRFRFLDHGDRTAPERHRTLRSAVDWSHDLCDPSEQAVWAACSVFAGDFAPDAAEFVCASAAVSVDQVLPTLVSLVDKSILTFDSSETEPRYRMLETIRQYGYEQLAAAGCDDDVRRRHRDYYLQLVERADRESCGPGQASWLDRLHLERPNIWAALDFCASNVGEANSGLRMGSALWVYWIACGFVQDGNHWLERLLTLASDHGEDYVRGLLTYGWTMSVYGASDRGLSLLDECGRLAERQRDQSTLSEVGQLTGSAAMLGGDLPRSIPLLDDALALYRASGEWTAPRLLIYNQRGAAAAVSGEFDLAISLTSECTEICNVLGERWALSWAQWTEALAWWLSGNVRTSAERLVATMAQARDLRDYVHAAACAQLLAWAESAQGDHVRAATLFGAASGAWGRIGQPLFGFTALVPLSDDAQTRTRLALGDDTYARCYREGSAMSREATIRFALGEETAQGYDDSVAEQSLFSPLTGREWEVARLVASGASNRDIATTLVISPRTAESHVQHIMSKLGFSARSQIATWTARRQTQDLSR